MEWYLIGTIIPLVIILIYQQYVSKLKSKDIELVSSILNKTYMDVAQTYLMMNRIDLSEAFQNDDETGKAFSNLRNIITYLWKEINNSFIVDEEKDVQWLLKQLDDIKDKRITKKKELSSLTSGDDVDYYNQLHNENEDNLNDLNDVSSLIKKGKE